MRNLEEEGLVAATWTSVEALGVPDSPVRRMLFQLADMSSHEDADEETALAAAAFQAVFKVLREYYEYKSPLEIQAEAKRNIRELRDVLGVEIDDIQFSSDDFELPPETPGELARQLGYSDGGRAVRRILRRGFSEHPPNTRWEPLTTRQVNYVKAHLPRRFPAA